MGRGDWAGGTLPSRLLRGGHFSCDMSRWIALSYSGCCMMTTRGPYAAPGLNGDATFRYSSRGRLIDFASHQAVRYRVAPENCVSPSSSAFCRSVHCSRAFSRFTPLKLAPCQVPLVKKVAEKSVCAPAGRGVFSTLPTWDVMASNALST